MLAVALVGCSGSSTTVLVAVSLRAGEPQPAALAVSVYDAHHALARDLPAKAAPLPGALRIEGLPDVMQPLRIVVRGGAAFDGQPVTTLVGQQATVALTLSSLTKDSDGDGVPDNVDDCPTVADPDQLDAVGDGVGDACRGDGGAPHDLTGADFAGVDLAGTDLAGVDLGGFVPSTCPQVTAFCEGFESGAINPAIWSQRQDVPVNTLSVDGVHVKRGNFALHVHSVANPQLDGGLGFQQAQIAETQTFPNNPLYVRAFIYIDSAVPMVRTGLLTFAQTANPFSEAAVGFYNTGQIENSTLDPGQSLQSAMHFQPSVWNCVELMVAPDPSDAGSSTAMGSSTVTLNGAVVGDVTINAVRAIPPYQLLRIGLDFAPNATEPAIDVWFDEIIVDNKPIGCTQ
jgi:hypothetical protein